VVPNSWGLQPSFLRIQQEAALPIFFLSIFAFLIILFAFFLSLPGLFSLYQNELFIFSCFLILSQRPMILNTIFDVLTILLFFIFEFIWRFGEFPLICFLLLLLSIRDCLEYSFNYY